MNPKKILVVDDEVDLVKTIQFSLEIEGYTVLVSNDGVVKKARNSKKSFRHDKDSFDKHLEFDALP